MGEWREHPSGPFRLMGDGQGGLAVRQRRSWEFTEEENFQIVAGVERGETAKAIAARLGRTQQSVKRHGNKILGLRFRPPWGDEGNEVLRELHRRGWTTGRIAEYMGRTRGAVRAQAARIGVSFARNGKA
jgi:DNA-binding NarL/FixJ family response regulator